MKVALFDNLPPGGAKRAARELVRHSVAGHEYHRFRITGDPEVSADGDDKWVASDRRYALPRWKSVRLPADLRRLLMLRELDRIEQRVAADIDAGRFDVAIVHSCRYHHGPPLLRHLATPSVYFIQEARRQSFEYPLMQKYRAAGNLRARARRVAATGVDTLVRNQDIAATRAATTLAANSVHSYELIYRSYGRYPKVVHLGVDGALFHPAHRPRVGVLAVGAVDVTKDHHLAVEAVAAIPADLRPRLTIVFEREQPDVRQRLTEVARRVGVELQFRRGVTDDELAEMYRTAVATVLTARLEPFGLAALESLASGTPVIAVREGGFRESVIDGENGYLVDRDANAIAGALTEVLSGSPRFVEDAVRSSVLPYFDWSHAAARFDDLVDATARVSLHKGPSWLMSP